jgi:two-component system nitrate/nitrite sensor histidine kinase NarX
MGAELRPSQAGGDWEELAAIVASTDDAIVGTRDGIITSWNPGAERLYGYSALEAVGQPISIVLPPEHPVDPGELLARLRREGRVEHFEAERVRKDGSRLEVSISVAPIRSAAGEVVGVATIARDVSHQKRVEAELREQLEQRVAERTRELSTLLRIAHDVASTLEPKQLMDVILVQLRTVVEYDAAAVLVVEDGRLVPIGYHVPEGAGRGPISFPLDNPHVAIMWRRLQEGPCLVDDAQGSTPLARTLHAMIGRPRPEQLPFARCWLAAPLVLRDQVIGALSLWSGQPGFFNARHAELAVAVASHAAVAIENARLYTQAQAQATAEERQRLARELHDAVTQTLFSASLIAEVLPRVWDRDPEMGRRRLEEVRQLTRGALAEMRMLLMELRPTALTDTSLADLLRQLVDAFSGRTRVPVNLTVEGNAHLAPELQVGLYRVAQEALNNVGKYAVAQAVTVSLTCSDDEVVLTVADDGVGFDPATVAAGHLGLGIMRERCARLCVELTVESRPGAGTRVVARWRRS